MTAAQDAIIERVKHPKEREFIEYLQANGVAKGTIINYCLAFKDLERIKKPLEKIEKEDLIKLFNQLSKEYEESTLKLRKILIKRFLQWVHFGTDDTKGYPECVRWIKGNSNNKRKLPKRILSKEEIKKLMDATDNIRDRALIFTLYESGCREGEFLNLKISDVIFDNHGCILRVNGKTGERRVRIFESIPDLTEWINKHPRKSDPNAALWITRLGKAMGSKMLLYLFKRYTKKAGLHGRITPHTLRHSRATHLATVLTEQQMKEFFGWEKDSTMPAIYTHLSGRDVDKTLMKHYGIEISEEDKAEDSVLKPRPCPRKCKEIREGKEVVIMYSPSDKFCRVCGAALDLKVALELESKREAGDKVMGELLDDDVMALLKKKLEKRPDLVMQLLGLKKE
jgi:integrase